MVRAMTRGPGDARQLSCQICASAERINQVIVAGLPARVSKGYYNHKREWRCRCMCRHVHLCRRGCRAGGWRSRRDDDERFHRVRHVFQAQLAHWVEHQIKPAGHVIAENFRDTQTCPGTGHLQPGGDDHAIAVELVPSAMTSPRSTPIRKMIAQSAEWTGS